LIAGGPGCETRPVRAFVALTVMFMVGGVPAAGAADDLPPPVPCNGCYHPKATTSAWQIQFQGTIDTSVRSRFFDLDGDVRARSVRALHHRGRKVACYLNAGAWENYRSDKDDYPDVVLGNDYEGYPEERWLDIRRIDLLGPIIDARIEACKAKHFDGIDPDNVNGFETDTGFPLTADDQLRFNTWLANEAHSRGLSIGMKNDDQQARALAPYFDWVIVEQCIQQRNCRAYAPYTRAGKPIFSIEYTKPTRRACAEAKRRKISLVFKKSSLGAYRRTCADVG
jgi:hypothetical protein